MRFLMWAVFLAGALASRYFFGLQGRFVYLVVVLVAIVLFRRPLVVGLTHFAAKFGLMKETIDKMPAAIRLARRSACDDAARPVATELTSAGFLDAGAWDIPDMPKIKLALMVHSGDNLLAAIETAPTIGAQVNLHTLYENGTVTTFTNSRLPAPKTQRPGLTSIRLPGVSPETLVARARAGRPRDGIRALRPEDAPRIYENLYAESIRHRKAQGG